MKLVAKFHRVFSKKHYHQHYHIKFNTLTIWTCTAAMATLFLVVYLYRLNTKDCQQTIRRTMEKICNQYYRNQVSGPFCEEMCAKEIYLSARPEDRTKGYYCPNASSGSNVLLIGTTGNGINFYLKEARPSILVNEEDFVPVHLRIHDGRDSKKSLDSIKWNGKGGKTHYPTEEEFLQMVNETIYFHYNMTMSEDKLKILLNFKQNGSYEKLHNFMENMWRLVHDNDFIMVALKNNREYFPNVLGHCGPYYATDFVQSFQISSQLERLSLQEWKQRLQKAILIMDYVDEVSILNDPISLCDIRYNLFGRQDSTIKYLSLSHVHPTYFIDRRLSDRKSCWKDIHCSYKHCKTKCDKETRQCNTRQLNNNYQVLCDSVFRGTTYSPGLLATSRASPELLLLLDRCADPKASFDIDLSRPWGTAKQLFDQVRTEVINLYDGLISVA